MSRRTRVTAPPGPVAPRTRRLCSIAVVIAAAAVAISPAPTGAGAAPQSGRSWAQTEDAATGDALADEPAPHLLLDQQTPWVSPGGQFTLRVAIPGPLEGDETIAATIFEATVSRADFNDEIGGGGLGERINDSGPVLIASTDTDIENDQTMVTFRFATGGEAGIGAVAAPLDESGVYPVEVRLQRGDGTPLDQLVTHLVRVPGVASEAPRLSLSVVMPIDGGPGIKPNGSRRVDPVGNERIDTLIDALTDHPDVPLVVVPTPDTVSTVAGGRRRGPLRDAVEGRQVLSSSYVPVDVSAWTDAGLDDDLALQTTAGEAALADHLVDRPDRRTAIAADTITTGALASLRELGADQVVIPEAALAPLDGGVFPVTLGETFEVLDNTGQSQRAAAADAGLSAHIDQTGDPVLDASTLLADLAVIYFDRPTRTRGVVVTLPRLWTPDPAFLSTLLNGLDRTSVVDPVTLDQLFARVPVATAGGENDPDGSPLVRTLTPVASAPLGGYPESLRLTRLTIHGFISLAGRENPLVASLQRRLLVSGSTDFSRSQRRAYLDGVSRSIDGAGDAVLAPETQTVTLTSRDGRIPLNLSNENLYDVTVRLEFDSEKLEFPDGDIRLVELPRSSVTSLAIDVRARSSGTFPLNVTITSPDDVLQIASSRITVRSTAISNVGLILSVGAGLFLALWWASHFRKVRRARKLVAADDAPRVLA